MLPFCTLCVCMCTEMPLEDLFNGSTVYGFLYMYIFFPMAFSPFSVTFSVFLATFRICAVRPSEKSQVPTDSARGIRQNQYKISTVPHLFFLAVFYFIFKIINMQTQAHKHTERDHCSFNLSLFHSINNNIILIFVFKLGISCMISHLLQRPA